MIHFPGRAIALSVLIWATIEMSKRTGMEWYAFIFLVFILTAIVFAEDV